MNWSEFLDLWNERLELARRVMWVLVWVLLLLSLLFSWPSAQAFGAEMMTLNPKYYDPIITPACALNPDLCEPLTADEVIKITAGEIRWQGNNPAITGDRLFAWTGDSRITCMTTGALPGPLVPCGVQDRSLPENDE